MQREPLQFDEHSKPATLIMAVSIILAHYGDDGCTIADIARVVQKNLPQWNPSSVSPCVSNLIWLECARESRNFGERRIFFVRHYEHEVDAPRLTTKKQEHLRQQSQDADERAGLNGSTPAIKMMFAIGENKTEVMTLDEARSLYEQLHAIFGKK